jgi:hypothetical protein
MLFQVVCVVIADAHRDGRVREDRSLTLVTPRPSRRVSLTASRNNVSTLET